MFSCPSNHFESALVRVTSNDDQAAAASAQLACNQSMEDSSSSYKEAFALLFVLMSLEISRGKQVAVASSAAAAAASAVAAAASCGASKHVKRFVSVHSRPGSLHFSSVWLRSARLI